MQISTKNERVVLSIHDVGIDEFSQWESRTQGKVTNLDEFWTLDFQIGKVEVTLYSKKERCKLCKEQFVDDLSVDLCSQCVYEVINE